MNCDNRLLEYLLVRMKGLSRVLIERDFLLANAVVNKEDLENFINANLAEKMITLLTELLEPIKEILLSNIKKENQEIKTYNNKYKKNRPLRELTEYNWNLFTKKLLAGAAVKQT